MPRGPSKGTGWVVPAKKPSFSCSLPTRQRARGFSARTKYWTRSSTLSMGGRSPVSTLSDISLPGFSMAEGGEGLHLALGAGLIKRKRAPGISEMTDPPGTGKAAHEHALRHGPLRAGRPSQGPHLRPDARGRAAGPRPPFRRGEDPFLARRHALGPRPAGERPRPRRRPRLA